MLAHPAIVMSRELVNSVYVITRGRTSGFGPPPWPRTGLVNKSDAINIPGPVGLSQVSYRVNLTKLSGQFWTRL